MPKTIRTLLTILLLLVLMAGVLLLLSWFVPDLRDLAKDLADQNDLPFWVAGMVAPIVYVFRRFRDGIGSLFASGASRKVDAISDARDDLRKEVDELLQWRRDTLRQEIQSMQATRAEMESVRAQLTQVQNEIQAVKSRPLGELANDVTDDELNRPLMGGKGI
ncbi:MAG TPA: hypothetical protein PKO15_02460 [Fibrobacteria bacterium]|nr:hypothetical protein [Fibrobacteria bacterium]HOX50113.1 hypothetical protein [Fibrobacteria bacterium]